MRVKASPSRNGQSSSRSQLASRFRAALEYPFHFLCWRIGAADESVLEARAQREVAADPVVTRRPATESARGAGTRHQRRRLVEQVRNIQEHFGATRGTEIAQL